MEYLEFNKILSCRQHGFRAGRSCLSQQLSHFDKIYWGLLEDCDTDALYLDFSKAFDKVDIRLLLEKLRRYGFNQSLVSWIESFLVGRTQKVVLDGIHFFCGHDSKRSTTRYVSGTTIVLSLHQRLGALGETFKCRALC